MVQENVAHGSEGTAGAPPGFKPSDDRSPEEQAAEEAVRRAEAELEKARLLYRRARRQAAGHLRRIRETAAGDLVDGAMKLVQKFPGPSVVLTLALGFFLGRSFRR